MNIKCYRCKGNHNSALRYQRQNRNSYNDRVHRNPTELPERDNKGSKLTNKIKFNVKLERVKKVYMKVRREIIVFGER